MPTAAARAQRPKLAYLIRTLLKLRLPLNQVAGASFAAAEPDNAATRQNFAAELRYKTNDVPSHPAADLLALLLDCARSSGR